MLGRRFISALAAVLIAGAAAAQKRASAPAVPYEPVAITLPKPMTDDSFDAMRKQLGEAAQRKDRAALARLVVGPGFFWLREGHNTANKRKSGLDNLSAALGLNNRQAAGWEILSGYAEDPSVSPSPRHDGALCAPAEPAYDCTALEALLAATNTDATDWGYPVSSGIDVHAAPQANAPITRQTRPLFRAHHAGPGVRPAVLHAYRHADRQNRLCLHRFRRADRQRPGLLRQGRRRLEDRRLCRRRRAAVMFVIRIEI